MDLPSEFETFREYFFSALLFLKRFQWVYNYPNIELLSQDIFRQIPTDFKKDFKNSIQERINDVILNTFMGNGTYDFTLGIRRLRLDPKLEEAQICSYEFPHNSSLSEKKRLEILYFAPAIHQFCVKNNIKYIIDVGCGLGYLTHLLNELYGYSVLGIDCNGKFIQAAYKNQEKLHPKSIGAVKFEEHFINDESAGEIEEMIQKHFPNLGNGKVAIVGLHACADLSVTIFELFNRLKSVKSLVIMPCCYHRLELEKEHDGCEYFQNFPLSNALQDIFFQLEGQHFLRRPFLRLACQQSRATFMPLSREDRRKQAQNWFFRAILELAACKEEFDAFFFHGVEYTPKKYGVPKRRNPFQVYIFYNMESPYNTRNNILETDTNFYNWTMTYRHDSDVLRPYGFVVKEKTNYTIPTEKEILEKPNKIAWFVSNCKSRNSRAKLAEQIHKYIPVDMYGKCGNFNCTRDHSEDCYKFAEKNYKFYLSFENSNCEDYVTEKLYNILKLDLIPIVYGGSDYDALAPPHSVIDVSKFDHILDLVTYINRLDNNVTEYLEYFKWKEDYVIDNTDRRILCNLCEKLNKPLIVKSYPDIKKWWYGEKNDVCKSIPKIVTEQ